MEERVREEKEDDDNVDESTDVLEQCDALARGALTYGQMNNMKVDKEVVGLSETVVTKSSGAMMKELEIEACQEKKMVGISKSSSADNPNIR
ncbi:hypothetical protein CsSME_00031140 [Camellia sinensis var. sinensis]